MFQAFQKELTPLQSDVTAVNQKGTMLSEQCRVEDADLISAQLEEINSRWDDLCIHSSERQQTIEGALLQLGQFQLALEELLVWVKQTNATLDEQLAKNVQGDVKFIEVEKAKHKVRFCVGIPHYKDFNGNVTCISLKWKPNFPVVLLVPATESG